MPLELGLKITRPIDGSPSTDLQLIKDGGDPLFLSQETETMFLLVAHLKGYKQDNIKININEDGTLIEIGGEKAVQEMVFKGWLMLKKEPVIRGFTKTFKIPPKVILDQVNAMCNEDDESISVLTIYMPKESWGKTGHQIEQVEPEQVTNQDRRMNGQQSNQMHETPSTSKDRAESSSRLEESNGDKILGDGEAEQLQQGDKCEGPKTCDSYPQESEKNVPEKTSKLFGPCFFMGTTIFIPLILLVFSVIRPKKKQP